METNILRFVRLGINEIDVENCDDRTLLLEWKSELEKDLASTKGRIEYLKGFEKSNDTYQQLQSAKNFLRLMGVFAQKIALRLSQLKQEKKQRVVAFISPEDYAKRAKIKEESRTSFPWFFLEVAKEVLTMKQFTEIEAEAYIRKNNAYEERMKSK